MEHIQSSIEKILNRPDVTESVRAIHQRVLSHPGVIMFLRTHPEIDQRTIERGMLKLNEYAEQMHGNQIIQKKAVIEGYQPVLHLEKGQIMVAYEKTQALRDRENERALEKKFKSLFLPDEVRDANFSDFDLTTTDRKLALRAASQFLNAARSKQQVKGLYLHGSFGVGKTYLLAAIGNALKKERVATILVHAPGFVSEAKRRIRSDSFDTFLESFQTVPVLLIDDIGAESISPWVRDELFGIILQYRMMHRLPTLFSSNLSYDELELHFGITNDQGDKLKAMRLMERIRTTTNPVEFLGENRRRY